MYGVSTKEPAEETQSMLDVHRISGFVLPRGLITVRLSPHFDIDAVSQRFDELGGQEYGVGSLVHGLLDVVVDGHFEAVQALDDGIESIEDDLFANNPRSGLQRKSFRLRKDLVELRRVVLPMREVVNSIQHRRLDAKTAPELDPLYADLYDHVLRVSEWTESLRDMVTTVFETNLSLQDAHAEHGDEEADGLGGDHCGADRDHWLLRAERRVSRDQYRGRFPDEHVDHRADRDRAVLDVPATRLVVKQRHTGGSVRKRR